MTDVNTYAQNINTPPTVSVQPAYPYNPPPVEAKNTSKSPILIQVFAIIIIATLFITFFVQEYRLVDGYSKIKGNTISLGTTQSSENASSSIFGFKNTNKQEANEGNSSGTNPEEKTNENTTSNNDLPSDSSNSMKWPDNEFTKDVPKPNFRIVDINDSVEEKLMTIAFQDVDINQVRAYADQLKAAGFTQKPTEFDTAYEGVEYYGYSAYRSSDNHYVSLSVANGYLSMLIELEYKG